jgi:hypothetical protein
MPSKAKHEAQGLVEARNRLQVRPRADTGWSASAQGPLTGSAADPQQPPVAEHAVGGEDRAVARDRDPARLGELTLGELTRLEALADFEKDGVREVPVTKPSSNASQPSLAISYT